MSKEEDLRKVYNLANELKLAIAEALNRNPELVYSKYGLNRDIISLSRIAEWALRNIIIKDPLPPEPTE